QKRVRRQADERVALVAAEAARRVAEENDRRSNYLSHASRVLSGSLDVGVGARVLLELVVPHLATLAVLQLLDEERPMSQVMVAAGHGDDAAPTLANADACGLPTAVCDALLQAVQLKQRITLHPNALRRMGPEAFGLDAPLALRAAVAVPLMIGE